MARKLEVFITGDTRGLSRAFKGAGKDAQSFGKVTASITNPLKNVGKALLGLGAGYAAISAAKDAISTTEDLAKTTIRLHDTLGLTTKQASEWGAVAKARGIDAKSLAQGFGTLSKQIVSANQGSKAAREEFKLLGVPVRELKNQNFEGTLEQVASGLARMPTGARKAAIAMKLFGRGWQTLIPILSKGGSGIREQLREANKYGASFGGKNIKSVKDFIAAQHEMNFALLGLKISFATGVIPYLTKAIKWFDQLVLRFRHSKQAQNDLRDALHGVVDAVKAAIAVVKGFVSLMGGWGNAIKAVAAAYAAFKIAQFTVQLVSMGKAFKSIDWAAASSGAGGWGAAATIGLAKGTDKLARSFFHLKKVSGRKGGDYSSFLGFPIGPGAAATPPFETMAAAHPRFRTLTTKLPTAPYKTLIGVFKQIQSLPPVTSARVFKSISALPTGKVRGFLTQISGVVASYRRYRSAQQDATQASKRDAAAQTNLRNVQRAVKDGAIKGAAASRTLSAATARATQAHKNYAAAAGTARKRSQDFRASVAVAGNAAQGAAGKVGSLKGQIQGLPGKKSVDIKLSVAGQAALDHLAATLRSVPRTVFSTVTTAFKHIGHKQHGGPVGMGRPYIVGERGPELFVPSSRGRIVPGRAGGGGGVVHEHIHVHLDGREVAQAVRVRALRGNRRGLQFAGT